MNVYDESLLIFMRCCKFDVYSVYMEKLGRAGREAPVGFVR